MFGETTNPTPAVSTNKSDGKTRFLICYQRRDASDVVLPLKGILAPFLFGIHGSIWLVYIAKTEDTPNWKQNLLDGRAYLFRSDETWKESLKLSLDNLQDRLLDYNRALDPSLNDHMMPLFESTRALCSNSAQFFADVQVRRDGVTTVVVEKNQLHLDDEDDEASISIRRELDNTLANQIFIFIKDIGHRHQHHHKSTDSMVNIYEYDGSDDISWRISSLYEMYREVISLKRHSNVVSFNDCLGIIAYAKTFRKVSMEAGIPGYLLPVYYDSEIIDSIKSTQARIEREFSVSQRLSDTFRNTLLGFLGIFISAAGLLKLTVYNEVIPANRHIVWVIEKFLERPIEYILILSVGVYAYIQIKMWRYKDVPKPIVGFVRFFQPVRRTVFIIVLAAISAAFFGFFVRIYVDSLRDNP